MLSFILSQSEAQTFVLEERASKGRRCCHQKHDVHANFSASGNTNSASQKNPLECLLGHTASEIKLDISNLADAKNAKPTGKAQR